MHRRRRKTAKRTSRRRTSSTSRKKVCFRTVNQLAAFMKQHGYKVTKARTRRRVHRRR